MDKATTDAITKVSAINAGIGAAAAAGTAAVEVAPAITTAALDPKNLERAGDFVAGLTPTPPPPSAAGYLGSGLAWFKDHWPSSSNSTK